MLIEIFDVPSASAAFSFIALGYLLSYSGTGLMMVILFLPFAVMHGRAILYLLLIIAFVCGLSAMGIIDLSVFSSRMGELEDTQASGFMRFYIGPFFADSRLSQFRYNSRACTRKWSRYHCGLYCRIFVLRWDDHHVVQAVLRIWHYWIISLHIIPCSLR